MMIVTICPTENSSDETLFALQFASRVRRIQLGPAHKNVSVKNLEETLKVRVVLGKIVHVLILLHRD